MYNICKSMLIFRNKLYDDQLIRSVITDRFTYTRRVQFYR